MGECVGIDQSSVGCGGERMCFGRERAQDLYWGRCVKGRGALIDLEHLLCQLLHDWSRATRLVDTWVSSGVRWRILCWVSTKVFLLSLTL